MQNNQQLAYDYKPFSRNEASRSSERECSDDISSNYNKLSDGEIVRCYNENKDKSAFSNIVARYRWKIHGIAVGITHDTHKADDIVQDVFLILVKKLHLFRREAKFSTWLYRVVVNATLAQLRKEKKYQQGLSIENGETCNNNGYPGEADLRDWNCMPDDFAIRREQIKRIENALGKIPEKYRVVFFLRDVEGHSYAEIAEILKLTLPGAKTRARRARLFLRDNLP